VAFVEVESAAFLVRKEGLDVEAFCKEAAGVFRRCRVADEINRFLTIFSPPAQGQHGAVSLVGEQTVGYIQAVTGLPAHGHVLKLKHFAFPAEGNVAGRAADILPAPLLKQSLKVAAIELAITRKNDSGIGGDPCRNLPDESNVRLFREMPLFAFGYHPDKGQSTLFVNQCYHESHATASDKAPIHDQHQRQVRQTRQEHPCKRKEIRFGIKCFVLETAADPLLATRHQRGVRDLTGHFGKMATACAHNAANETGQRVEPSYEITLNVSQTQFQKRVANGSEYFLLSVMAAS
jgi:hypothetical protein